MRSSNYKGKCRWCSQQSHLASFCASLREQWTFTPLRQLNRSAPLPQASYSNTISQQSSNQSGILSLSPSGYSNSTWLLDSGASHHITNDLQNLSLHSDYEGTNDIMIGNGKTLPITQIGSTSLHAPSKSFQLNNIFCP